MDLLQTVRKEGSRGGRSDFKWEDVKADAHRENYLGHSLMAPVGRWQRNKDLGWYAKGDDPDNPQSEADARAEELRRIKEAEEDAMAAALGLPVPVRDTTGANAAPLGKSRLADKEVKQVLEQTKNEDEELGKGRGLTGQGGLENDNHRETLEVDDSRGGLRGARPERRRDRSREKHSRRSNRGDERKRRRSRSGSRERDRRRRSRSRSRDRSHRHSERRPHRSRSREHRRAKEGESHRRHRSRTGSRDRPSRRYRSRSPRDRHERRRD